MCKFVFKIWLIISGLSYSLIINAEEIEKAPPLVTEIEFGYQAYSGNSDSNSLNARIGAEYKRGRYRSKGELKYFMVYKDGVEDKRQSIIDAQTDYKIGAKNYTYGSYKRVDSKYSAYFKNCTLSAGLGYQFAYTKDFVFELEGGPGYRYQKPNTDKIGKKDIIFPETVEEMIVRGKVKTSWQVLPNLALSADVTVVSGKSNTQMDTDLSAINNISESIALKLSHNSQYYNRVPEGLSQRDSIFSANLLFVF
ncbi:DUF481 domain-containing protein [Photobacterium sp. OFAV2-7]|uniref:DUF481 domain-containing protein n=1 Tax=Photobacterium sp. OFAV2-7 TaxID=2917748 RepID=UPI001EF712FA|nr:DUF481 domain-containing protein [Photobacterium sp. OFAV2-7]MCG7586080.1 DUF481 domain-containing protein [Photobacterium sp. OFAV2-7]